jgi:hypothetical protein
MPQSPAVQKLKPQAPGSAGANKVGEFTQVFGRGEIPQPAPSPPALGSVKSSGATQAFQVPAFGGYPGYPAAGYPGVPGAGGYPNYYDPYAAYKVAQPSDFTQKFSAPAPLTLGQAPKADQASAPAAPRKPVWRQRLPLILAICGGALALILLILFLVFR